MGSLLSGVVQNLKQSSTVRSLKGSVLIEVALESMSVRLPLNYRLMRLISRSKRLRSAAIRYYARRQQLRIATTPETVFPSLDVNEAIRELNLKGFALGIALPPEYVEEILEFCSKTRFIEDGSKESFLIDLYDEAVPKPGALAYRCANPHNASEVIDRLAHDPAVVQVARGYLQAEPVLRSTRIFYSYPDLSEAYNCLYGFHYDIDDYKFLKLFFYLCDVDQDRGPHVIIEQTHTQKDWFEQGHRRLTDEQALARYGDKIRVITGSKGFGFFEDTFCYHKGTKPRNRRLMFEIEYAISNAGLHH